MSKNGIWDYFSKKISAKAAKFFTKSNWNLLKELTRSSFKDSDYNTILGFFWSFLNPCVLLFAMFFIFRSRFGRGIEAYPLYILLGIVFVGFLTTATSYVGRALLTNRDLALNSTTSRENIIISSLAIYAYKFFLELICCGIVSFCYGFFNWSSVLLFFPLFVAYVALVLGIIMVLTVLFCFARDVEHIWALLSRVFLFVTPIFYSLHQIHPSARVMVYFANPVTPFLISMRQLLIGGGPVDMLIYAHSLMIGIVSFVVGYGIFIVSENIALERA